MVDAPRNRPGGQRRNKTESTVQFAAVTPVPRPALYSKARRADTVDPMTVRSAPILQVLALTAAGCIQALPPRATPGPVVPPPATSRWLLGSAASTSTWWTGPSGCAW